MKRTFCICFSLAAIYLVSSYTMHVVEAEMKEIEKPLVEETASDDNKNDPLLELNSDQEIEKNVEVKDMGEEIETKIEEGMEKKEEASPHVIIIPEREEIGNSNFQPEVITVKVNEKIIWINEDSRTHFVGTMVIGGYPGNDGEEDDDEDEDEGDEGDGELPEHYFTSGYFAKDGRFEYSFDTPGEYIYYCFTHPIEMKGKIIVVEDK